MNRGCVKILIKYLAVIRDSAGREQEEISFPPGSTLQDVADRLNDRYELGLPDSGITAIINGRGWSQLPEKLATKLKEGDVVCLFAPLSGG